MANLSITAGSVKPGSSAVSESGLAGEAVTAGQVVYRRASDGKFLLADSNSATAEVRSPYGVALNSAAADAAVLVQRRGNITIGATVVAGTPYFLGDTPGALCPAADVGSGEYTTLVGIAVSTTTIKIDITEGGVATT